MIAQHYLARRHTGNGFNAFANFFPDAGREFRGAEGASQVKVYCYLTALNLYLIQQAEFAERTSDFGVTSRSSRCTNCIKINLPYHRVGFLAILWWLFWHTLACAGRSHRFPGS